MRLKQLKFRNFLFIILAVICLVYIGNKKILDIKTIHTRKSKSADQETEKDQTVKDGFTLPLPEKYIQREEINNKKFTEEIKTVTTRSPGKVSSHVADESACKLARLKLDDPEIKGFFKKVDPLKCRGETNWVQPVNATFYIVAQAVKKHGQIKCDYDNVWRLPGDYKFDSKITKNFQSGAPLMGDFFGVQCTSDDGAMYSNMQTTVKPSSDAIKRSRATVPRPDSLNLNVYMFGFDSLSRMTFMRKLPKTYKYLKETLKGVVLEGYNIVGDGTPQALIPIFTGKTELELPLTRKRYKNATYVNAYPFIWNEFRNAGYATMYAEDAPDFGVFQYRLKGFDEQPTDHYLRTFYLALQSRQEALGELFTRHCLRNEPHHKVHFRYSEDMFRNYPRSVRKFSFSFHATLSHDDLNLVEVADADMVEHLKFFTENGHLNDTVLMFMSDHGHRFDKLRETQQGKLEERLPFFSIVMPPWFESKYPKAMKNLRINARRLTTPFDIHPTLRSLLNFTYPPKVGQTSERGISLFREIPSGRTCMDADVALHWCACLAWKNTNVKDPRANHVARKIVSRINAQTEPERGLCAKLRLHKIEKFLIYELNDDFVNFKKSKDKDGFVPDLTGSLQISYDYFQVTFRTQPGDALYEASVTWDRKQNDTFKINLDEVSHINKYGDLPHCIINKDYFQAKWCVCYDKIKVQ